MAITINLQPTSPKYSYSELVYSVSSDLVGPSILPANVKQQYSFVVDIYVGANRIQRFRKQPNPVGVGVFDLSDVFNDFLELDLAAVGSTSDYPGVEARKTFSVRFGEEYIDSGVLKIFNGSDVVGDPATNATNLVVYKGFDEYDTISLTTASTVGPVLSSDPLISSLRVHRNDKLSVSVVETGAILHYNIQIPSTGATGSVDYGSRTINFNIYDEKSILDEVRFAWFNRKGGIDWFTADQEGTSNTSVDKSSFNATNVDYGVTIPTNRSGNTWRSSENVYSVDYNVTHTKNTRWLSKNEADSLQGLFDSPVVYVQDGGNMRPVIITNSYEHYTFKRQQPLFQYNIEYRYTNDKRGY